MIEANEEGVEMTDEDIKQNLLIMIFAGHETASSSGCSLVSALASNKEMIETYHSLFSPFFGVEKIKNILEILKK